MKKFLLKIGLVDYLTTKLQISKKDFSRSKYELWGKVDSEGFKMKRWRRFFDSDANSAIDSEQHIYLTKK